MKSQKTRATTAVLAIFLGGIGADQFYLDNKKRGLFILCLTILIVGSYFVGEQMIQIAYDNVKGTREWTDYMVFGRERGLDNLLGAQPLWSLGNTLIWSFQYTPMVIGLFSLARTIYYFSNDEVAFNKKYNAQILARIDQNKIVSPINVVASISSLKALKDSGALSEEEYKKAKDKLLAS